MDNLYDSMGRKIIVDRTNGPWTPEGGYGGAGHYAWQERIIELCCSCAMQIRGDLKPVTKKEGADNG